MYLKDTKRTYRYNYAVQIGLAPHEATMLQDALIRESDERERGREAQTQRVGEQHYELAFSEFNLFAQSEQKLHKTNFHYTRFLCAWKQGNPLAAALRPSAEITANCLIFCLSNRKHHNTFNSLSQPAHSHTPGVIFHTFSFAPFVAVP